jgi:hypothetical protein
MEEVVTVKGGSVVRDTMQQQPPSDDLMSTYSTALGKAKMPVPLDGPPKKHS